MLRRIFTVIAFLTTSAFTEANEQAQSVSRLKEVLNALQAESAIAADFEYSFSRLRKDGDEEQLSSGLASVLVKESDQGLSLHYSNELLAAAKAQAKKRVTDELAPTPELSALGGLGVRKVGAALSASEDLLRRLTYAEYIDESFIDINGQTLRQLNFALPLRAVIQDKKTRNYVKKFSSQYHILVDEQFRPVQSKFTFSGKGRAYVVISLRASGEITEEYQVVDDRLIRIDRQSIQRFDSSFGGSEQSDREKLIVRN